jgi:hypothetical protein
MNSSSSKLIRTFLPILVIFLIVTSFSLVFTTRLERWGVDQGLVIVGNIVLFFVTIFSFVLYRKALLAANTHAFIRNVYSGMLLKLFVCIGAAFIYIVIAANQVNKSGIFILMGLYLLYTFLEIRGVLRLSRQIKQGSNG